MFSRKGALQNLERGAEIFASFMSGYIIFTAVDAARRASASRRDETARSMPLRVSVEQPRPELGEAPMGVLSGSIEPEIVDATIEPPGPPQPSQKKRKRR